MLKTTPDYQDADLVIKLYKLRRDPVMRESRAAISRDFWPKSFADVKAMSDRTNPVNPAWRQVTSYWEMVFGMARHGIVHPDYLAETSGEGLYLFAKVQPYLAQYRAEIRSNAFVNAEWMATECEAGKKYVAESLPYIQQVLKTR